MEEGRQPSQKQSSAAGTHSHLNGFSYSTLCNAQIAAMTLHDEVSPVPRQLFKKSHVLLHAVPLRSNAPVRRRALQVEIEDMEWDEALQAFTYQCPCGDLFQITLAELAAGEPRTAACSMLARLTTCSLNQPPCTVHRRGSSSMSLLLSLRQGNLRTS